MSSSKILVLFSIFFFSFCNAQKEKESINQTLDGWHKAAADANFDAYFGVFTDSAHFIGTDANENWDLISFQAFSKPFFDKGKAWNFTALQRNIYLSADKKTAWFDELLNTQMKLCRGSGVLVKEEGKWKIEHYVLSMTIPNENTTEVVKLKSGIENITIKDLQNKKP